MCIKKHLLLLTLVLTVAFTGVACSHDDDYSNYPERPIQLIVAFTPGAATDTQVRILAKYAEEELGQPVVIQNIEGAGGQVGWNEFSEAEPDGYTLAAYNLPHILAQPLVEDTEYSREDFEPIMNWGYDPTVFAVREDSPYETLEDLLEDAKENPGEISIGKAGLYIGHHFLIMQIQDETGVEFNQMPFPGGAEALSNLLGGHIDVVSGNLSDMYRQGDEVRILAVAAEKRHEEYAPKVPTFKELGYESAIMSTDRGVAAPKGTPDEVIERLEEAFYKAAQNEEYLKEMDEAGADTLFLERDEVKEEYEEREVILEDLLETFGHLE
ncbi:tripartite tricarboxylate transporter substrate binding protein [Natranaerobius trueperi]|uniref:C4-dicarboxylate ABC transporter substrate-binding protein n=1 Tax=Natranaerobius trueperi TaxID=759412 RepID=A0A226BZY3_9FIRM|nr:tripartite tricarboxylate transporter substrate binding protein [Natranaerobius trueperi]OWZ83749.1 C4-dicarboxylate ABC transporter substrate-binding protein [Natranaerobius trueperi]